MCKVKKAWIIRADGIMEFGYVTITWFQKSAFREMQSTDEARCRCTHFRFKWMANMYCRLANFAAETNYELRTFTVEQYQPLPAAPAEKPGTPLHSYDETQPIQPCQKN